MSTTLEMRFGIERRREGARSQIDGIYIDLSSEGENRRIEVVFRLQCFGMLTVVDKNDWIPSRQY